MHHAGFKYTHTLARFFSPARVSSFSFFCSLTLSLNPSLYLSFVDSVCFFFRWPTPKRAHTLKTTTKKKTWNSFHTQSKRTEHENYYGKINRFLIREKYNFNVGAIAEKNAREHKHTYTRYIGMSSDESWYLQKMMKCEKQASISYANAFKMQK